MTCIQTPLRGLMFQVESAAFQLHPGPKAAGQAGTAVARSWLPGASPLILLPPLLGASHFTLLL